MRLSSEDKSDKPLKYIYIYMYCCFRCEAGGVPGQIDSEEDVLITSKRDTRYKMVDNFKGKYLNTQLRETEDRNITFVLN